MIGPAKSSLGSCCSLPAGTYEVLPGRAHLPYLEAPGEVASLTGGASM